jgi:hypothetical protein
VGWRHSGEHPIAAPFLIESDQGMARNQSVDCALQAGMNEYRDIGPRLGLCHQRGHLGEPEILELDAV